VIVLVVRHMENVILDIVHTLIVMIQLCVVDVL
jgi:hypothetical protein